MYWRPIKYASSDSGAAGAGVQWKQITPPHDRLYKIQAINVVFTTATATYTEAAKLFVRCKDVSVHPASSSDVLWEVISPVAQAQTKVYYYHIAPNVRRDDRDTDAIIHDTDHISFRIPKTIISTGQSIEIGYHGDSGADGDAIEVYALLQVAGHSESI